MILLVNIDRICISNQGFILSIYCIATKYNLDVVNHLKSLYKIQTNIQPKFFCRKAEIQMAAERPFLPIHLP